MWLRVLFEPCETINMLNLTFKLHISRIKETQISSRNININLGQEFGRRLSNLLSNLCSVQKIVDRSK